MAPTVTVEYYQELVSGGTYAFGPCRDIGVWNCSQPRHRVYDRRESG